MLGPLVKMSLFVPVVAAIAMLPQDPQTAPAPAVPGGDVVAIATITELNYTPMNGAAVAVPARNIAEIRLFDEFDKSIRLELVYDNGDYSLLDVQGFHLLRNNGGTSREVRLVRTKRVNMRFPRLP